MVKVFASVVVVLELSATLDMLLEVDELIGVAVATLASRLELDEVVTSVPFECNVAFAVLESVLVCASSTLTTWFKHQIARMNLTPTFMLFCK